MKQSNNSHMHRFRHNQNSHDPSNRDTSVHAIANRNGHRGLISGSMNTIRCPKAWVASATETMTNNNKAIIVEKNAKTIDNTNA